VPNIERLHFQFDCQKAEARIRALAARCARSFPETHAPNLKRARGMPGAQCTRSLVRAGVVEYAHQYSQRRHRNHPAGATLEKMCLRCSRFLHRRSKIPSADTVVYCNGRMRIKTDDLGTAAKSRFGIRMSRTRVCQSHRHASRCPGPHLPAWAEKRIHGARWAIGESVQGTVGRLIAGRIINSRLVGNFRTSGCCFVDHKQRCKADVAACPVFVPQGAIAGDRSPHPSPHDAGNLTASPL